LTFQDELSKYTLAIPIKHSIRGRPRKRWIEDIEEDFQVMGIRGWRKLSKERMEWKKITEKAIDRCNHEFPKGNTTTTYYNTSPNTESTKVKPS
jgi:hypothetical protein